MPTLPFPLVRFHPAKPSATLSPAALGSIHNPSLGGCVDRYGRPAQAEEGLIWIRHSYLHPVGSFVRGRRRSIGICSSHCHSAHIVQRHSSESFYNPVSAVVSGNCSIGRCRP